MFNNNFNAEIIAEADFDVIVPDMKHVPVAIPHLVNILQLSREPGASRWSPLQIMSTVSIVYTVIVAMLFGGSYKASGCLKQLMESLTKHVKGIEGLLRMAMGCTIVATLVTNSSTMGTWEPCSRALSSRQR